ncbi:ADP-ribose glycohydrolase MACROD1 [Mactra antiquata]
MTISNRKRRNNVQKMSIKIDDTQTLSKYYDKNIDERYCETQYEGRESLNKKIRVYIGDITQFDVDAIVCPVQTNLNFVPYGSDTMSNQVHKQVVEKIGSLYEEQLIQISECEAGDTFVTEGFSLDAKYIIHTAGLPPTSKCSYEVKLDVLKDSYNSCLNEVYKNEDIRNVAFPCLGCGGGGIELNDAINIAATTIRKWLETGDNIKQVDSIILVMYDDNQWQEYKKTLTSVFPYGKDLAGIDAESLQAVTQSDLANLEPQEAHSSHILCFHYKRHACREISKHFHTFGNMLHKKMAANNDPVDRYKTCMTFRVCVGHHRHGIILFHGLKSHTVEVKVICYSPNVKDLSLVLCEQIQTHIDHYLVEHLENTTSFKTHIRCERSNFGDKDGYISSQQLNECLQKNSTYPCKHKSSGIHLVYPDKLLTYWTYTALNGCGGNLLQRQPVENDEMTDTTSVVNKQSWLPLTLESSACSPSASRSNMQDVTPNHESNPDVKQNHYTLTSSDFNSHQNTSLTKAKEGTILPTNQLTLLKSRELSRQAIMSLEGQQTANISGLVKTPWQDSHQMRQSASLAIDSRPHIDQHQMNSYPVIGHTNVSLRPFVRQANEWDVLSPSGELSQPGLSSSVEACGVPSIDKDGSIESVNLTSTDELSDKRLLKIARVIGNKEEQLGIELGLPYPSIQNIKSEYASNAVMQAFKILYAWKVQEQGNANFEGLKKAMTMCCIDTSDL